MKLNLLEALAQVQDFRAPRGRRYPLGLILLLVLMGTISGCLGYRALEDFARRHHHALASKLQLPPTRFPSDSTFRRVLMRQPNAGALASRLERYLSLKTSMA